MKLETRCVSFDGVSLINAACSSRCRVAYVGCLDLRLSPGFNIFIRLAMVKSPSSKHFARLEVALPDIAVSSGSQVLKVRGRFERDRRSRLFLEFVAISLNCRWFLR